MNAAAEQMGSDKTAVRPFRVDVPEAELTELRRRIKATRLPEKEPVADMSQGVPLATVEKLARYWANDYDWRKCEARINAFPNFITEIDGLDIHFIHARSKHENALPIIVTHGWPYSVARTAQDHRATDQSDGTWRHRIRRLPCGDPVDSGLRIFGKADLDRLGPRPHRTRLGGVDESSGLHALRGARR